MEDQKKEFGVFSAEVKEVADQDRVLRFMGTTPVRDRMNDEIPLKGWEFDNYMSAKGPVLWAHKYDELPLGRTLNIEKAAANGTTGFGFDVEFLPGDVNPKAEQVFQILKRGFPLGVSVGFKSKKSSWIAESEEEKKEREKISPDLQPGKRFETKELLELSVTPVPANPEALQIARKKGMEMPRELHEFLDRYVHEKATEAIANTKRIKEEFKSQTENDPLILTSGSGEFTTTYVYPQDEALKKQIKELEQKIDALQEEVRGSIEDSDVAQPDDGIAETVPDKDEASSPDAAQSDSSEIAETASEAGGPEHISKDCLLVVDDEDEVIAILEE